MNIYKKNVGLLAGTQKTTVEIVKNIAKLQTGFSRELVEDWRNHCKNLASAKSVGEHAQLHSRHMKEGLKKVLHHGQAVTGICSKSWEHVGSKVKKHYADSIAKAKKSQSHKH
jgi:phasin family protein